MNLTFFHDFASPFSYLASTQVERICAPHTVEWRPILLGGLFKKLGTPNVPLQAMSEPRRRYQLRDLAHWADHWQVRFSFPTRFPMNTVAALRMVLAAPVEKQVALSHAFYRAYWAEDRDLADRVTLVTLAGSLGLDGEALFSATSDPAVKQQLHANTDGAHAAGAFGVPSFLVGDQLFWGQDRLDLVRAALENSR
jgi:2-hydroxychromene-2-carboxylate isomerase